MKIRVYMEYTMNKKWSRREGVRTLILGCPALKQKIFGTFFGEIHRVNPEVLGYSRIPSNALP